MAKTMKVVVNRADVITLGKIAKEFKTKHDLKRAWAEGDLINFETNDGEKGWVEVTGYAYHCDHDGMPWDEFETNWCDFLGYTDLIWADDENGKTVAIHN